VAAALCTALLLLVVAGTAAARDITICLVPDTQNLANPWDGGLVMVPRPARSIRSRAAASASFREVALLRGLVVPDR
jgi:hypothetical protein